MAVTLYGPTGLSVAGHAQEELRVDLALVPIPHLQTEEGTVVNLGELQILENVTGTPAPVNILHNCISSLLVEYIKYVMLCYVVLCFIKYLRQYENSHWSIGVFR